MIRLNELKFRACEGYYSKAARRLHLALLDHADGSERPDGPVYEALVHWADVIIVATPIRWGAASSLYFKMAERLNCVQNQITIRNQRADPQQGRGLHHRRRAGQHPGAWPARCSASSPSSASSSRSFPSSRIRAAGRPRTWSTTSRSCAIRKELAEGAAMLAKRCLDLAAAPDRAGRGADARSSAAAARRIRWILRFRDIGAGYPARRRAPASCRSRRCGRARSCNAGRRCAISASTFLSMIRIDCPSP